MGATTVTKKTKLTIPKKILLPAKRYEILINTEYNSVNMEIKYNSRTIFIYSFAFDTSDISCGVNQIFNLPENPTFTRLINAVHNKEERDRILDEAFINMIEAAKNNDGNYLDSDSAFILMSNNMLNSSSRVNEILDRCFTSTESRKNPNSNNQIKIWIA